MTERYGNAPENNVIVDELYEIVKVNVDESGNVIENEEEYQKSFEGQTNEDGSPKEAPIESVEKLRIRAYIGTEKVRDEITRISHAPIAMFCWDDEAYATSFMEDLMPLNKSYDIFISKLEHKVKKLDTGRYTLQKGEDTKVITTNDGEFIRYKRFKPDLMAEAGVPNAFGEAVNRNENDMREQGVALTSAAGLPQGVDAWRAIESVKEIDFGSIGTQLDNLNECLTDLAEKLIEMLAFDMTSVEKVIMKDENGKAQVHSVIGKRGADLLTKGGSPLPENTIVIDPNRNTIVEIESDMTWTQEGRRNLVLDLIKGGYIPKEMALEALKFGNTKDILQKLIEEATYGKSMIDAADFKMLPVELQQAILKFLSQGGTAGGGIPPTSAPAQ